MKMPKDKNMKNILILICMCVILVLVYEIIHIYAVFHSEVSGNVQLKKGVWSIVVNGTDIAKGVETSFVIDKISTQSSEHVKSEKLAPGLSGSFEISINPQNTDVSVKYEITLSQEGLTNSNLKIKSIQEVQEGNSLIKTAENTYTAIIPLEKIKQGVTNKIRMEVEWNDDGLHDKEDTDLGSVYNTKLQIPVTVRATQYLGETITPYIENTEETEST